MPAANTLPASSGSTESLIPTADGRHLILPRYTQPDGDHKLLLHQLGLKLPEQPPPRIRI